jgi:hypothetical protein
MGEHCDQKDINEAGIADINVSDLETGEIAAISIGVSSAVIIALLLALLIVCKGGWMCSKDKRDSSFRYRSGINSDASDNLRMTTLQPLGYSEHAQQWPEKKTAGVKLHYYPESSPDWDVETT